MNEREKKEKKQGKEQNQRCDNVSTKTQKKKGIQEKF